ncbi:GDPmannose 4,6-dehydratase [Nakamurella panacisegetis]|uniref:GDP-mannose 4,6-dehydratase n=1 Tax=Nakamurella panacisegetis TaxID=1090615 RepID=A0A1H0PJ99_9ACTN|nr:GDP-mannose 4,6-dehydratase [Nakamurella panacisegetis]SDP04676.1 GDPmannose 4,6-dehydratase [Nakamurella panacisegetis]
MAKVFITGVSGQDGGYLAEQLLAAGDEVHGLVREQDRPTPDGSGPQLDAAHLHVADLTDGAAVTGLINEIDPDEIYNLAGMSSVARSWAEPVATGLVSGLAAATVLQAAWELSERRGRSVRVVQAASAEIFGNPAVSPQDESAPIAPVTPYGAAKAYAHHMVHVYRGRGLHAVSAILYNHESPRRPATFVTRKITRTAALIARGEADELVLGNLDARRDWGWAPDYVDAMVRAARAETPDDYVVATGVSRSVSEFVAAAFDRAGIQDWAKYVRVDPAFVRPVDAVDMVGDASRARNRLGWSPTKSFPEIVAAMVDTDLSN